MIFKRTGEAGFRYLARRSMAESASIEKGTFSVAFVTIGNENDAASNFARELVKSRLAACVNVVPQIKSIYEWEGKIEEANEQLLIIKTRTSRIDDLIGFVKKNHPYSVPEVITTPIEHGNPAYLKWLGDLVKDVPSNRAT